MITARGFHRSARAARRFGDWCLDRAAALTADAFRWPLVIVVGGTVTWSTHAAPPAVGSEDWEILHPHGEWIRSLRANGMMCCDWSDTRPVKVRTVGDHWQIWLRPGQIEGAPAETWLDVPPDAVIHGPNPVGVAIASYWGGKVRCFVPPGAI